MLIYGIYYKQNKLYFVGIWGDVQLLKERRANDGLDVNENQLVARVVACIEVPSRYWPTKDIPLPFRVGQSQSL